MNIYEAAKVAKATGMGMYRTGTAFGNKVLFYPTNSKNGCIIENHEHKLGPRWQPYLDDLIAEDWAVGAYRNYDAWRSDNLPQQLGEEF